MWYSCKRENQEFYKPPNMSFINLCRTYYYQNACNNCTKVRKGCLRSPSFLVWLIFILIVIIGGCSPETSTLIPTYRSKPFRRRRSLWFSRPVQTPDSHIITIPIKSPLHNSTENRQTKKIHNNSSNGKCLYYDNVQHRNHFSCKRCQTF